MNERCSHFSNLKTMKNKLNAEEQLLQEKLNQAEAGFSFQESSWQEMQQLLPKKGPFGQYGTLIKAGLGLILLVATSYFINNNWSNSTQNKTVKNELVADSKKIEKIEEPNTTQPINEETYENSENSKTLTKTKEPKIQIADAAESPVNNSLVSKSSNPKESLEENQTASNEKLNADQEIEAIALAEKSTYELGEIKIQGKSCIGGKISAEVNQKKGANGIQLKWLINENKLNLNTPKAIIDISKAGLLKIEVFAIEEGEIIDSRKVELMIEEIQEVNFTYHDLETPYDDLKAEFTAKPEGILNLSWKISAPNIDLNGEKVSHLFDRKGIYDVTLSHKSKMGCITEITKPVAIETNFKPLAPDAFTPDGNDLNETFIPVGFTPEAGIITNDRFRMSIYDYNARLVYTTTSNTEPWNGKLNNQGNILAEGTYVWKVDIENTKGQQARYAGKVQIR